jgi:hypothetical protein
LFAFEFREGAGVFGRSGVLDDLSLGRAEALPHTLVDAERLRGPRLVEPRIVVIACDLVET